MNSRLGGLQRGSGRLKRTDKSMAPAGNGILDRPSRCFAFTKTGVNKMASLYNVLYTVNTQQYISTVIFYTHSGHITSTFSDRKRLSSGQNIFKVQ